jgi:hypothetical protein
LPTSGINDPRNDGPPFEIDDRQASAAPDDVVADRGEAAISDQHLRDDAAGAIHGVDPAIHEAEIARLVAARLRVQPDGGRDRREPDRRGRAADELPSRKSAASVFHQGRIVVDL